MVTENDKATEARRKALRNGEEDPVVVAQRFLNIYRQMHIFSSERKESFDKMLMELSPDIRGIFSSLPGGAMLQDYVDELAEKNGLEKSVHAAPEINLNDEANQQAQILAAALAKAQTQTQPQVQTISQPVVAPVVSSGTAKLSMDKDFAGEFARIMGSVLQQQTTIQKESLEKMAQDIGKTQLFIAKSMKEGKEEQRQELRELCKTIAESSSTMRDEQRQELNNLCRVIIEGTSMGRDEQRQELNNLCRVIIESTSIGREDQRQELNNLCKAIMDSSSIGREEQRQEIATLCKTIAATQASMNKALEKNILSAPQSAAQAFVQPITQDSIQIQQPQVQVQSYDDSATRQLIEVVLDGQKQINQRLDKVEQVSASLGQTNDNSRLLLEAFEKSQAEMVKSISSLQYGNLPVKTTDDNEEKLIRIIGESQEKLINTLLSTNFQQNNNTAAQANNNANNIQINTPDNSAQLVMLVDKISALQATNEQNLEKAITKVVAEQSKLYDKTSARQTKELAAIIAEGLKEGFKNLNQPVYVSQSVNTPVYEPQPIMEQTFIQPTEAASFNDAEYEPVKESVDNFIYNEPEFTSVETELEENAAENPSYDNDTSASDPLITEENAAPKKKKKKKKKNKNKTITDEVITSSVDTETVFVPQSTEQVPVEEAFDLTDLPEINSEEEKKLLPTENNDFSLAEIIEEQTELQPQESKDVFSEEVKPSNLWDDFIDEPPAADSGSDWGFGGASVEEQSSVEASKDYFESNDNQEGEDWEWVYVEDDSVAADDSQYMEAIGDNSYICSGNLYAQDKADETPVLYSSPSVSITQSPQIFNDGDEELIDPYQNSILKD